MAEVAGEVAAEVVVEGEVAEEVGEVAGVVEGREAELADVWERDADVWVDKMATEAAAVVRQRPQHCNHSTD